MYSRYEDNSKRPIRLPEHYGGSAFSQQQQPTAAAKAPKREVPRTFSRDGVGEKASPVADRLLRAEAEQEKTNDISPVPSIPVITDVPDTPEDLTEEKEEKSSTSPIEKKPTASPINFEGLRRLLGGGEGAGDKDRLLLLGLILLLSRTEGDSDILLWLSLLLLCG
ncbi:MAG: hypothetical protein E7584_02820 [Ruminococcaceae bacterium]|nr:hypothetical protein [Oscillospiraceae bacterium]